MSTTASPAAAAAPPVDIDIDALVQLIADAMGRYAATLRAANDCKTIVNDCKIATVEPTAEDVEPQPKSTVCAIPSVNIMGSDLPTITQGPAEVAKAPAGIKLSHMCDTDKQCTCRRMYDVTNRCINIYDNGKHSVVR